MQHERGKDPTPQGREPGAVSRPIKSQATDTVTEKYENSAPGPDVRKDGAYFFGYKRENANPETR